MNYQVEVKQNGMWTNLCGNFSAETDALAEASVHSRTYRRVRGLKLGRGQGYKHGYRLNWEFVDGRLQLRGKGKR